MAIQQINLGSMPLGAGGDSQRAANTKINENFTNPGNAASRLVGTGEEQIPLNKNLNLGTAATKNTGIVSGDVVLADHVFQLSSRPIRTQDMRGASYDLNGEPFGSANIAYLISDRTANSPITNPNALNVVRNFDIYNNLVRFQEAMPYNATTDRFYRVRQPSETWTAWAKIYTNQNTNKGTNGVLSEKSPVTHLYHDRVEHTGDEKELEPIEFIKHGVGDYLLKNTTGLAQEGWYIVIPQDANGNPLIAVEYDDNDGDINIRTYKRKFDYEQAKVIPDHDNPMDIPETRWIDLRFNDDPSLYDEVTDEPFE